MRSQLPRFQVLTCFCSRLTARWVDSRQDGLAPTSQLSIRLLKTSPTKRVRCRRLY